MKVLLKATVSRNNMWLMWLSALVIMTWRRTYFPKETRSFLSLLSHKETFRSSRTYDLNVIVWFGYIAYFFPVFLGWVKGKKTLLAIHFKLDSKVKNPCLYFLIVLKCFPFSWSCKLERNFSYSLSIRVHRSIWYISSLSTTWRLMRRSMQDANTWQMRCFS